MDPLVAPQENPCQWCGADIFAKLTWVDHVRFGMMLAEGKSIHFEHNCEAKARAAMKVAVQRVKDLTPAVDVVLPAQAPPVGRRTPPPEQHILFIDHLSYLD